MSKKALFVSVSLTSAFAFTTPLSALQQHGAQQQTNPHIAPQQPGPNTAHQHGAGHGTTQHPVSHGTDSHEPQRPENCPPCASGGGGGDIDSLSKLLGQGGMNQGGFIVLPLGQGGGGSGGAPCEKGAESAHEGEKVQELEHELKQAQEKEHELEHKLDVEEHHTEHHHGPKSDHHDTAEVKQELKKDEQIVTEKEADLKKDEDIAHKDEEVAKQAEAAKLAAEHSNATAAVKHQAEIKATEAETVAQKAEAVVEEAKQEVAAAETKVAEEKKAEETGGPVATHEPEGNKEPAPTGGEPIGGKPSDSEFAQISKAKIELHPNSKTGLKKWAKAIREGDSTKWFIKEGPNYILWDEVTTGQGGAGASIGQRVSPAKTHPEVSAPPRLYTTESQIATARGPETHNIPVPGAVGTPQNAINEVHQGGQAGPVQRTPAVQPPVDTTQQYHGQ